MTDEIKFTDNKQFKIFKNKQTGKIYALIEDVDSNDKNENWIYEIEQFKLNKLYKLDTRQPIKEIICYDDGYYLITYGGYVSKLSYEGETLLESFSILGALYRICRLDYCNEQFITSVCEAKSQDVIFVSTEWRFYVFNKSITKLYDVLNVGYGAFGITEIDSNYFQFSNCGGKIYRFSLIDENTDVDTQIRKCNMDSKTLHEMGIGRNWSKEGFDNDLPNNKLRTTEKIENAGDRVDSIIATPEKVEKYLEENCIGKKYVNEFIDIFQSSMKFFLGDDEEVQLFETYNDFSGHFCMQLVRQFQKLDEEEYI